MANDIVQTIAEARIDARSLSEFVYKPADFMVSRRLASSVHTLQYYLDFLDSVPSLADTAIANAVNDAILNTGFELLDSFADGATITKRNQALKNNDSKYYRWDGSLPKTVPSGSTPASSGGTGTGKWLEVSDSALRTDLAKTTGAGLVNIDVESNYPVGTVGNHLQIKRVMSKAFLPTVTTPKDSGYYLLNFVPDAPFDGIADVRIYPLGAVGRNKGYCELTSNKEPFIRKAIANINDGVWTEWQELPTYNRHGELEQQTGSIQSLTRGSYSWWSEPQALFIDGIYPKTVLGAVDARSGAVKAVTVDSATQDNKVSFATLKTKGEYRQDEHNPPVTVEARGTLVTFYPAHNDATYDYLPYRVSKTGDMRDLGAEQKVYSAGGLVSYAQAIYSEFNDTLYVAFRAGGANGQVRSWHIASSTDWDADEPNWVVNEVFTDTNQLYFRFGLSPAGNVLRCVLTKNASFTGTNGFWFGYISLVSNEIKSDSTTIVGTMGGDPVTLDLLTVIKMSDRNIRLYDFKTIETKVGLLYSEFDSDEEGGAYKYLEFNILGSRVLRDSEIVQSGRSLGYNFYFGGASFQHSAGVDDGDFKTVYLSREESGTWYIEEWTFADGIGDSWKKVKTYDSSNTDKLWRPKAPYNSHNSKKPNTIKLIWCRGVWADYNSYNATIKSYVE